jgi:hypothetical protein
VSVVEGFQIVHEIAGAPKPFASLQNRSFEPDAALADRQRTDTQEMKGQNRVVSGTKQGHEEKRLCLSIVAKKEISI